MACTVSGWRQGLPVLASVSSTGRASAVAHVRVVHSDFLDRRWLEAPFRHGCLMGTPRAAGPQPPMHFRLRPRDDPPSSRPKLESSSAKRFSHPPAQRSSSGKRHSTAEIIGRHWALCVQPTRTPSKRVRLPQREASHHRANGDVTQGPALCEPCGTTRCSSLQLIGVGPMRHWSDQARM